MQDALRMIRSDLGPDAAVLHTREVRRGLFSWFSGREIEVTASAEVRVPSHWPDPDTGLDHLKRELNHLQVMVAELARPQRDSAAPDLPDALFRLYTDLIEAEVGADLSRELVDTVRQQATAAELEDPELLRARLTQWVAGEIEVSGPIRVTPGQRRMVALVGPTGVGKTTTIAKLAANFHLREHRRVGLITVDTYRIAAVEQLRTYADIIDLPMEVVATPREMREAVQRLSDLDLILLDTAGRSPRDDVKIRELKSMLGEARADEVHLVLSSVSSVATMKTTAQKFAEVGATSLVITKLDESTGLGNLIPTLRACRLPISYVTHGQNVPADIAPADRFELARLVLGSSSHA